VHRLLLALLLLVSRVALSAPTFEEGDIIFHTSRSSQSLAIQQATRSPYSHMGVVLRRGGELAVFEASATVRYTPLKAWIARGVGGQYVLKRVKDGLTEAQQAALRKAAQPYENKRYDLTFEWSDEKMYCSELVWKLYQRVLGIEIGKLEQLRDFDLTGAAVKQKIRERYKGKLPLDEPVISPAAMFNATNLTTVSRAQ
jgi:uncharacterized protein YycO